MTMPAPAPAPGPAPAADILDIGEGFCARTFPAARFHHREHLLATVYLLVTEPARDWRRDLPAMIRAYNVAQGGVNDDTRGYHHTITRCYLELVARVLALADPAPADLPTAGAIVLASAAADPGLLLRYYSRERLFSPRARRGWLDPDRAAMDYDALARRGP